jgi:tape measure domain-containing protein
MADLGTIEGKVVIRGLGEAKQEVADFDRTLDAFSKTADQRFKRVKVSADDVARAMGLTGDSFKRFQEDALRAFTGMQAVKGLETLARNCGYTKEAIGQMGRQMGLTEQSIASLVTKLNAASSQMSSKKFFNDFYKTGQHTAVIPTADIEKSIGTFEKSIEVAFGRIPVTVNTATAAVDDAFAKGAAGISSGARRYAQATASAINDFYKTGQHTAVVQGTDVFESMFRDIDKTNEAFSNLTETVKTSTVPLTSPLGAFQSAISAAGSSAKRSGDIIGSALGYSEKQLDELHRRAQQGIDVKVKTDALRVLRDEANLSKEAVADLEKQLGVKLKSAAGLFGEKGFGDIMTNTFAYGSAYQLLGYVQQMPGAIFSATSAMEKFEKTYSGVFGDSSTSQMEYVTAEARKYGKELESVSKQNLKFAATAEYLGMSQDSVRKIFDSTIAAVSKVGGSTEDVNGTLVAMQQMLSKGTVSAEEFRSQFAERIPGAMKMGADAMGVTTAEFRKMMEEGQIVAQDFLPKLADQMAKFAQGWERGADSIEANTTKMFNTLKEIVGNSVDAEFINTGIKIADNILLGISSEIKKSKVFEEAFEAYKNNKISQKEWWNMGGVAAQTYKAIPSMGWMGNEAFDVSAAKAKLQEIKNITRIQADDLKEQARGIVEYIQKVRDLPLDASPDSATNIKAAYGELARVEQKILQLTGTPYTVVLRADVSAVSSALAYIRTEYGKTMAGQADMASSDYDASISAQKNLANEIADLQAKVNGAQREGSRDANDYSKNIATLREKEAAYAQGLEVLGEKQESVTKARKAYFDNTQAGKGLANADQEIANASRYNTFAQQRVQVEKDFKTAIEQYTPLVKNATLSDKDRAKAQEAIAAAEKSRKGRLEDIAKAEESAANKGAKGANAAAHYAERTSAYLEQAQDQYDQLAAQLGGDSLGAKIAAIEKEYDKAASAVRQAMIGAKGSTEELSKTLEIMGQTKATKILLAEADAWKKSMQDAANMLAEIGRLSGDPAALYGSSMTTAQAWEADQAKRIGAIQDENEKTKQLGELRQVMALKELEAKKNAYAGIKAVSSEYWNAEAKLIESNLATVKANATDETAYKIYAAQQWDEFYKAQMEQQAATAGTFAETLAAKWSLAFGGYESETTKTKKRWDSMSDSIVNSTNGMIDGIAGGFGDMIRNIGNGTASIEDLWKNMLARMLDAFASFVEELVKTQLKDIVGGLFSGSDSGGGGLSLSSLFGGSGGVWDAVTSSAFGKSVGDSAGESLLKSIENTTNSSLVIGDAPEIGKSFADSVSKATSSGNYGTYSVENLKEITPALSKALEKGASSGWKDMLGGAGLGAGIGAVVSGVGGGNSTIGTIGGAVGGLIGTAIAGPLGGAIGGLVGGLAGLFDQQKKEDRKKTASGYNVAYAGGKTVTSGVDFYSDGSVVGTGVGDPDVTKKISDAFKDAAENLSDFADVLGFTVDVLEGFQMPSMNITSDQLDTYIRNGTNMMAFKALEDAGLRGAFDALAEDGEVYIDEVERLATAYSTGASKLSAYGYEMADVAQVTQAQIDDLRTQTIETAQGTAQATMALAESMGATSSQMAELAANASDGSQALAVTDEQLSNLLEADWMSKVLDNVGGEDAFNAIMDNLLKNVFDNIGAYAENLDYYNTKAQTAIAKLGDSSVTVDNFWDKFNEALKNGLDPDQFEIWSKASTWVNSIDTVNQAVSDWNDGMTKLSQSLDSRMQTANGLDYQSKLTKQMADAEWELADARKAGYDAAYISRLQEVQAAELAATVAKHQEDYAKSVRDASKRYAEATDDSASLVAIAMEENALELQDLAKQFNWSVGSAEEGLFRAVQKAQWAEIINMIKKTGEALATSTRAMRTDLDARKAALAGYDKEAEAIQKVAGYATELSQAVKDGLDDNLLAELMQVQIDELAKYWSDAITGMRSDLADLYRQQSDLLDSLSGNTKSAIDELYALFTRYQSGETALADDIIDSLKSIGSAIRSMVEDVYSTIYEIRTGKSYSTDDSATVAANSRAYFEEQYTKAAAGDTEAMGNVTSYAKDYLTALRSSTADQSVYQSGVDYVTSMLSRLGASGNSIGGNLTGIGTTVTNGQITAAQEALHRAEVAQLKSQADAYLAQAEATLQGSDIGNYLAAFASTGVGWQGIAHLLDTNTPDGTPNFLASIRSGGTSIQDIISWMTQYYGTGNGYVDWASAVPYVAGLNIMPASVIPLFNSYQSAYSSWQSLRSQYGFATGGMIEGGIQGEDSVFVLGKPGEAVLTERQTDMLLLLAERIQGVRLGGAAPAAGGNDDVASEVAELRREVARQGDRLRQTQDRIVDNTQAIASMLTRCGGKEGYLTVQQ